MASQYLGKPICICPKSQAILNISVFCALSQGSQPRKEADLWGQPPLGSLASGIFTGFGQLEEDLNALSHATDLQTCLFLGQEVILRFVPLYATFLANKYINSKFSLGDRKNKRKADPGKGLKRNL